MPVMIKTENSVRERVFLPYRLRFNFFNLVVFLDLDFLVMSMKLFHYIIVNKQALPIIAVMCLYSIEYKHILTHQCFNKIITCEHLCHSARSTHINSQNKFSNKLVYSELCLALMCNVKY